MKTSWLKHIRPVVLALFVVLAVAPVPAVFGQQTDSQGQAPPGLPPPPPPPPPFGPKIPEGVNCMKIAGKVRHSNHTAPLPTSASGIDFLIAAADIFLAIL